MVVFAANTRVNLPHDVREVASDQYSDSKLNIMMSNAAETPARKSAITCASNGGGHLARGGAECPWPRSEPGALPLRIDDGGVGGDAVDDDGDEAGVGDDMAPFIWKWQVRSQGDGGFLFAFGRDLEQQLAADRFAQALAALLP